MSREVENGIGIGRSRIETLTDGVFAIVMTILVLELAVPNISHANIATELPKQILQLWPVLLSYVMSFIVLGFFWIGHDYQFHFIKRSSRTLLWITILYLMFIALIPFSTSLLGEYWDHQISVIIYGTNLVVASSWIWIQWWCATKDHSLIDQDLDQNFVTMVSRRFLVAPITYLIAVALSFVSTEVSIVLYIATPLYYVLPSRYRQTRSE
jgi:uncharacterized membrane protein